MVRITTIESLKNAREIILTESETLVLQRKIALVTRGAEMF